VGSTKDIPTPPETVSNEGSGDDDDDELTRQIEAEAASLPVAADKADDDDWAEDTNEEAVAARMKELNVSGAVAKLMDAAIDGNDDDDEDAENDGPDPLDVFADYIHQHVEASDQDIVNKSVELGLRDHKVCVVLSQVLFDAKILSDKQIARRASLLRQFIKNEKCQKGVLGGLERLVGMVHPDLLPKVALILKAFYDEDLIEEDVFLAWGDKASKKYVDRKVSKQIREKAEPFLEWLRNADEDDEEDE
jgi:translation initiation factor 5